MVQSSCCSSSAVESSSGVVVLRWLDGKEGTSRLTRRVLQKWSNGSKGERYIVL
jgi:hypothetical protein